MWLVPLEGLERTDIHGVNFGMPPRGSLLSPLKNYQNFNKFGLEPEELLKMHENA